MLRNVWSASSENHRAVAPLDTRVEGVSGRFPGLILLCAVLGIVGCSQRPSALAPGQPALESSDAQLQALEARARAYPASNTPVIGSHMVDYRAVLMPATLAIYTRAKFQLGPTGRAVASTRKAVRTVSYLQAQANRSTASTRHILDSTCYFLLTFTNYDDGTSELTNVDSLGCVDDGSDPGSGGGDVAGVGTGSPAAAPATAGCSSVSKTAGTAMQNISSSMPGIMNSTTQSEAYSYIYSNGAGTYFWDSIQTVPLDSTGHATPNPPANYPGYTLVGFVHTHPQNSGLDTNSDDDTYNTYFSEADFNFAKSFNPPIAMFVGINNTDTANYFYQLQYTQSGTDANGNPTYKVTGETAGVGISASGC